MNKPLRIVTSCTRNYGWVTRAFLEGNTRWADYIIIVDQMSTDGTREMCAEYKNVVILDDSDMSYHENLRAKVAFMKGRELAAGRDAIYFALDIDEVMPANWTQTEDGKKILASKPGDMFQIEWANILPDGVTCNINGWNYKVFHDNGMDWQEVSNQMHTPLLPYSSWDDNDMISVHDFPLLHFGQYHVKWIYYKSIYYQFLDIHQNRSKSAIKLYRTYHGNKKKDIVLQKINKEWLLDDGDLIGLVDVISTPIFIQYIKELISEEGVEKFQSIDVWSNDVCEVIGEKDPRSFGWKVMHAYLRVTRKYSNSFVVKGIDKFLKLFV